MRRVVKRELRIFIVVGLRSVVTGVMHHQELKKTNGCIPAVMFPEVLYQGGKPE